MDKNIRAIYKILTFLQTAMDYDSPDFECISYKNLGISKQAWSTCIEMLTESGYVKGASVKTYFTGEKTAEISQMQITLKGLEYLYENTLMKKVCAEEYAYNHEEIERELGYKIEKGEPIECDPMKLSELRKLLEEGWVIIDTKPSVEKHFKYLTLIDSHWIEE